MALDAGMVSAVCWELDRTIGRGCGENPAKVEKIYMPDQDEIHLLLRGKTGNRRLVLSASSHNPRVCFSERAKENPAAPPMMCMQLRKHLSGARVAGITQLGFDRALEIEFDTQDDFGYPTKKYIVAELMGKYSNLIFLGADRRVLSSVRTTDISSPVRQVLPGMRYEPVPLPEKNNPLDCDRREFLSLLDACAGDTPCEKWMASAFYGLSSLICREIVFRAASDTDAPVSRCDGEKLWFYFSRMTDVIRTNTYDPCVLYKKESPDVPFAYSFTGIRQYGADVLVKRCAGVSGALDEYYDGRDRADRMRQRSQDIFRLLQHAQNRLLKKLSAQREELVECDKMEQYRLWGDLITQEMYRIRRGDTEVRAIDYSSDGYPEVLIPLDKRLSPSQNAQAYYKKYQRKKNAREFLTEQIRIGQEELAYIDSVLESLSRAETEKDLAELREELSQWGYGKRDSGKLRQRTAKEKPAPTEAVSPGGYRIYIGKNNIQNDMITTRLAEKNDYWFHVKNFPGAHVLLSVKGKEPSDEDLTLAAEFAAYCSKAQGANIPVDYTLARYVKKPAGSKPGYVIYEKHQTAYVSPSREKLEQALKK